MAYSLDFRCKVLEVRNCEG